MTSRAEAARSLANLAARSQSSAVEPSKSKRSHMLPDWSRRPLLLERYETNSAAEILNDGGAVSLLLRLPVLGKSLAPKMSEMLVADEGTVIALRACSDVPP